MKTCESCRHHYLEWRTEVYSGARLGTARCRIEVDDPVTGKMGNPECVLSRLHERFCGWEARWWEGYPVNVLAAPDPEHYHGRPPR